MKYEYTADTYLRLQNACHRSPRDLPVPKDVIVRRHIGALREAIEDIEKRLAEQQTTVQSQCCDGCKELSKVVSALMERVERLESGKRPRWQGG